MYLSMGVDGWTSISDDELLPEFLKASQPPTHENSPEEIKL